MKIKVKISMMDSCEELLPTKAHADDAAFDLRSRVDMTVPVNKSTLVPTGVFI